MAKNNVRSELIDYPRYISSKPCGKDKTKGEAQRKLVEAIANYIISRDVADSGDVPRIIGLRGEWGSGKSNVIKQLKENDSIKKTYYVYEFDAWGHQEDPLRRSFLESLTNDLLQNEILPENEKRVKSSLDNTKITWREKLNEILAHKHVTRTNNIPILDGGSLWVALVLLLMPLMAFVANLLHDDEIVKNWIWLTLIVVAPILILLFIWLCLYAFKDKKKYSFGKLLQLSKQENAQTINEETIYEEEPTVAKFQKWMNDLSNYFGTVDRKLIVVFDNMDRLPSEKVRELWSSIHTFFAETGYDNVWTIIPFDETHLAQAFGEDEVRRLLTKHFISKSLPIVFRVATPVDSDWKELYDSSYDYAFGPTEQRHKELVFRIYRISKRDDSVRALIEFLNSLVTYKQVWKNEIPLSHIAIFVLREDHLSENAAEKILSGSYLGNTLQNIIPNDERLQTSIAMLYYGVETEIAKQVPLKKYINSCITSTEYDINKYYDREWLVPTIIAAIDDLDKEAYLDDIISGLSKLNREALSEKDNNAISGEWSTLARLLVQKGLTRQEFTPQYKFVLENVDESTRNDTCDKFVALIQNFKEFDGAAYYSALAALTQFIQEHDWEVNIDADIQEKTVDIKTFISYIRAAKEGYTRYKLKTDNNELNSHFKSAVINSERVEDLLLISYLNSDSRYAFNGVLDTIAKQIEKGGVSGTNFYPLISTYKLLEQSRPLPIQLDTTIVQQLYADSKIKENPYATHEIETMMVAKGLNIQRMEQDKIEYAAKNMHYYITYSNLILLTSKTSAQKAVAKCITENKLGEAVDLKQLLPNFETICSDINITALALLEQIDCWENNLPVLDAIELPRLVTKSDFFKTNKDMQTSLTRYLFNRLVKGIMTQEAEALKGKLGTTDYWGQGLEIVLDSEYVSEIKDMIDELGALLLKDPLSNEALIPAEGSLKAKIIERMDRRKSKGPIQDIRNKFCNGEVVMTPRLFRYYHSWLEDQGKMETRVEDVVRYIIEPVIVESDILKSIIVKNDIYANLIKHAEDYAISLKDKLSKYAKSTSDEEIVMFAKKVDAWKEDDVVGNLEAE